ncbi:unnamed protein product [Prunus armeniaca]|nr:unnamed protein product [Prunus armeniaca]
MDGFHGRDKEQMRQTILKHESVFRHQKVSNFEERTCEFSRQAFSRSLVQFKQGKDRLDCSLVLLPLGVKTFLTGVPFTLLLLAGSTCSLHQPIFGFKNRMYISIESAPFWKAGTSGQMLKTIRKEEVAICRLIL